MGRVDAAQRQTGGGVPRQGPNNSGCTVVLKSQDFPTLTASPSVPPHEGEG